MSETTASLVVDAYVAELRQDAGWVSAGAPRRRRRASRGERRYPGPRSSALAAPTSGAHGCFELVQTSS
jgi:hypothetical protein